MKKEQDQALSRNFGSWVRNNSDRSVFALATKPKRIDFIKSVYVRCRSCARARLNFSSQKFMDLVGCEMAQMEGKKNPNEFGEFVLMLITRTNFYWETLFKWDFVNNCMHAWGWVDPLPYLFCFSIFTDSFTFIILSWDFKLLL